MKNTVILPILLKILKTIQRNAVADVLRRALSAEGSVQGSLHVLCKQFGTQHPMVSLSYQGPQRITEQSTQKLVQGISYTDVHLQLYIYI